MNIQENYPLKLHNTLSLQQHARYFAQVTNVEELQRAYQFLSTKNNMDCLVIGDGSNIVFGRDYPGLIIKNAIKGIAIVQESDTDIVLEVGAGENWHGLVCYALKNNWCGLENLALIPGTAGAAPVQNIGAYGVELRDVFVSARAWDSQQGKCITLSKQDCAFTYRDSIFKHPVGRFIITHICVRLSKVPSVNVSYQALKTQLDKKQLQHITPQDVFDAVLEIRRSRLPDPALLPNAGSFFKNPIITRDHYKILLERYPQLVAYPADDKDKIKLAAAWLIDQAGWKGVIEGKIAVHDQQALVLVNRGGASGEELLAFADKIRQDIKRRYNIDLEIEPLVV